MSKQSEHQIEIAVLLYDRLTALDAIGPYEVLSRIPGASLRFVAGELEPVHTDNGLLGLLPAATLEQVPHPDVVVVPGGPGEVAVRAGERVLDWLRSVHETTTWTTSVCTGSLVLAAAGLLDGVRATTHWMAMEELRALGAEPVRERVVFDGRLVTAAGVSAGIDMGLALAGRIAGEQVAQAIQLGIEYDPQPPFNAGSPLTAPPEVVELLRAASRHRSLASQL
jgi:transcriptional regulator GlxA family with amidase domain